MEVSGKHRLPLPPQQAWSALNSTRMLRACIPGCVELEPHGDGRFEVVQELDVVAHRTRFSSELRLEDVDPPHSYVLRFSGNGGQGGFGIGHALIALQPDDGGTCLNYRGEIEVGGRLAQLGRGPVEDAVKTLIEEFFERFERVLRGEHPAPRSVGVRIWRLLPPWVWGCVVLVVVFLLYIGAHRALR